MGRVDPDTGKIIPTAGKRGRKAKKTEDTSGGPGGDDYIEIIDKLRSDCEEIQKQNLELIKENKKLKAVLAKIEKAISNGTMKSFWKAGKKTKSLHGKVSLLMNGH